MAHSRRLGRNLPVTSRLPEVGAYTGPIAQHGAADDNMLNAVIFTLYGPNGDVILNTSSSGSYWTNGFVKGEYGEARELRLDVSLSFREVADAKAYIEVYNKGLEDDNTDNIYYESRNADNLLRDKEDVEMGKAELDGNTVKLTLI